MHASVVVTSFGCLGEPVEDLDLGFLKLLRTLSHTLLKEFLLVADLLLEETGPEKVLDAKDYLDRIERLAYEVRGPQTERILLGLRGDVSG